MATHTCCAAPSGPSLNPPSRTSVPPGAQPDCVLTANPVIQASVTANLHRPMTALRYSRADLLRVLPCGSSWLQDRRYLDEQSRDRGHHAPSRLPSRDCVVSSLTRTVPGWRPDGSRRAGAWASEVCPPVCGSSVSPRSRALLLTPQVVRRRTGCARRWSRTRCLWVKCLLTSTSRGLGTA
jgi:hypothetical protein